MKKNVIIACLILLTSCSSLIPDNLNDDWYELV